MLADRNQDRVEVYTPCTSCNRTVSCSLCVACRIEHLRRTHEHMAAYGWGRLQTLLNNLHPMDAYAEPRNQWPILNAVNNEGG